MRSGSDCTKLFFSGRLESLGASEKNRCHIRKNIFDALIVLLHIYILAIARDRGKGVKTAFKEDLGASYSNGRTKW